MTIEHIDYLNALGITCWQLKNGSSGNLMAVSDALSERANLLFDAMLEAIELARSDICFMALSNDLEKEIAKQKPSLLLALGATAGQSLLNTTDSLPTLREKNHVYGTAKIPLIVTYHPNDLLQQPVDKSNAFRDLQIVMNLLQE